MAIKVKGNEFTATVGGDFSSALAAIKRIDGRKYDSSSKTWTVPVSRDEFIKAMRGYPIDINNSHVTAYGNGYGQQEWSVIQVVKKIEAEKASEFRNEYEQIKARCLEICKAVAPSIEIAKKLHFRIIRSDVEREMFSSDEKYQMAVAIETAFHNATDAVSEAIDEKYAARLESANSYWVQ